MSIKLDRRDNGLPGTATVSWPAEAQAPVRMDSNALLGRRGLLVIEHRGEAYYLRITRNDKLILTK